jgi:polyhydroxyalkanoate synthesis regulator phasin
MFDLIKKALLTGVGLGVMTKEKIEELAAELSKRADLTEKQGEALIADLLVESEKATRALDNKVSAAVRSALEKMEMATKRDVATLEERILRVEQRLISDDSRTGSK